MQQRPADLGTNVVQFLGPDDETHLEILEELGSEDVERIVRYVERLQFPGRLTMFPFTCSSVSNVGYSMD